RILPVRHAGSLAGSCPRAYYAKPPIGRQGRCCATLVNPGRGLDAKGTNYRTHNEQHAEPMARVDGGQHGFAHAEAVIDCDRCYYEAKPYEGARDNAVPGCDLAG